MITNENTPFLNNSNQKRMFVNIEKIWGVERPLRSLGELSDSQNPKGYTSSLDKFHPKDGNA